MIHLTKAISVILIIILLTLCFSGCAKLETRTDIEPLQNHLPDLSIKNAHWYGGVKEDRFSGIGPCTVIVYGVAEVDEEFAQSVKEEYKWERAENGVVFDLLSRLNIDEYPDIDNYVYSKDFTQDIANTFKIDIFFDFKNNSIIFYAEYIDF